MPSHGGARLWALARASTGLFVRVRVGVRVGVGVGVMVGFGCGGRFRVRVGERVVLQKIFWLSLSGENSSTS